MFLIMIMLSGSYCICIILVKEINIMRRGLKSVVTAIWFHKSRRRMMKNKGKMGSTQNNKNQ